MNKFMESSKLGQRWVETRLKLLALITAIEKHRETPVIIGDGDLGIDSHYERDRALYEALDTMDIKWKIVKIKTDKDGKITFVVIPDVEVDP